jgi:2,4-diketo-3-deoxy-L-fuconate hydrolase
MRFANLDGRLALSVPGGYADVASASQGRFGPGPGEALDEWPALSAWAAQQEPSALQPHLAGGGDNGHRNGAPHACPPVPQPRQVFGIGLNYRDHVAESGFAEPAAPAVFTNFPSCLTGPYDTVTLPPGSVDWEVELVVVIGRKCERVAEEAAWSHVADVMVGQGLSERQLQLSGPAPQFSLGKSFPGFGPVGPELVTIDELPDPDDLALGCELDGGVVLQRGRTSDLIFPVPELIGRLSAVCPLLPGDLIFTGTPSGVGGARTPPQFLGPGDVLVSWIEGVGSLRNAMAAPAVTAGPPASTR